MNNKGIFVLRLLMVSWNLCFDLTCSEGEHDHTPRYPPAVRLCKDGTFRANGKCHECSRTTSDLEVIRTPCNKTHDAEIHCVSGYYRRKAQTALEKDRCVECRICVYGFPARPCLGYNDTVCCPLQHDAVWTREGQYECKERPAPCVGGMYYNTTFDTCLSCPNGTYMPAYNHATRECLKCAALSGNSSNHAVILQPCTRTSPTVFGCEDFYFRASDSGSLLEEAPCSPCQNCRREVRQCQILHDAVCADHEGDDSSGDTGGGQTADVPESGQVTHPTKLLEIYQIAFLVGDMLLHLLLSWMHVFKLVYTRCEGFQLKRILREGLKLYRDYYLSLYIVSILFQVLVVVHYNGYFGGFAQDDIFITLAIVSVLTSVVFFLFSLLSDYITPCLNAWWGIICVGKRLIQNSVNRWWIAMKHTADATPEPQAQKFINSPERNQSTTAM